MNFLKKTKIFDNKMRLLQIVGAVLVCMAMGAIFIYCYVTYGEQIYSIFGSTEKLQAFLAQFKGFDKWVEAELSLAVVEHL